MGEYYANPEFRIDASVQEEVGFEEDIYCERYGYHITSFINSKPPYLPAFKLYYGDNEYLGFVKYSTAKMCRISLLEPKYLNLEGEDLVLNKEQKLRLMEILKSPNVYSPDRSNWDVLLGLYNAFHRDMEHDTYLDEKLPMPDYTKLPGGD